MQWECNKNLMEVQVELNRSVIYVKLKRCVLLVRG
jgi:hypothetical protein